jgi:hypothetical protein
VLKDEAFSVCGFGKMKMMVATQIYFVNPPSSSVYQIMFICSVVQL